MRPSRQRWILLGALLVGLLVRLPGVFWGVHFPTGWAGHHVDEYTHVAIAACLLNPSAMESAATRPGYPEVCPNNYPRGMAAHVVIPAMLVLALRHQLAGPLPPVESIFLAGRAITVLYGVGTIYLVYLLAGLIFRKRPAIALGAAWIFALGGLHVSQSHFFLGDVPVLFWLLVGQYFLARDVELYGANPQTAAAAHDDPRRYLTAINLSAHYLNAAAFCLGVAFGVKLSLIALPSLLIAALLRNPRITRCVYAGIFFVAGLCIVNLNSYSPYELYKTLQGAAVQGGYHFNHWIGAAIYVVEWPSIVSIPIALLSAWGAIALGRRFFNLRDSNRRRMLLVAVILPLVVALYFVLFTLDNFPRHLLTFVPWVAIAAAWSLDRAGNAIAARGLGRAWVIVPVFIYLALFVYDGERVFWNDPRNRAEQWVLDNVPRDSRISWLGERHFFYVPGYTNTQFSRDPQPDVIVCEMHFANIFLSGTNWRNSYPQDITTVWPWFDSKADLTAWQSLFKGTSGYEAAATFSEGYFMPEYRVTDKLLGNRSRNYVSEVVIFRRSKSAASK